MRGTRRWIRHRGLESALVSSEDGAEARKGTKSRGEKCQEVDCLRDRSEDMDLSMDRGMGYCMGKSFMVGQGSREGGLRWRVGSEECKGKEGRMGD